MLTKEILQCITDCDCKIKDLDNYDKRILLALFISEYPAETGEAFNSCGEHNTIIIRMITTICMPSADELVDGLLPYYLEWKDVKEAFGEE